MSEDEATRAYLFAALQALGEAELGPELADLPGTLIEDLIAPSQRRPAGEFYTPRWLAERTVMLSGFPEADEGVLLDPCCGAGAMLVAAMRLRGERLEAQGVAPREIASQLVARLSGYDLSPLAVLAARVACWAVLSQWIPGERPELQIEVGDALKLPLPRERERAGVREIADCAFLVGNPPWIRWSDVPAHQADRVRELARQLDLIPRQVWHGGSEVDLSVVIALATSANHLKPGGRSALVLPRSHLHAPASAPFRRLTLPDGTRLQLEAIEDYEDVPAFRGANVKSVIAVWSRTNAPRVVSCARYERQATPAADQSWSQVSLRRVEKTLQLSPSDGRWCLVDPGSPMVSRLLGETNWVRGRKGVTTDLNEAYFVRAVGCSGNLARVVALPGRGRRGLSGQEFEIETELLWPLLKGAAQIEPFRCLEEQAAVIVPNSGIQQYPSLEEFTSKYPAAAEYFARIERDTGALSRRATFRRTLASRGAPPFLIYNVGDYTFQPYKVVWPEITARFRAAVAVPRARRAVVPDHKVYFAAFDELEPADFLCAFLNAPIVRQAVEASTARLQIGTLLKQIKVPGFDPQNAAHAELSRVGALAREQGSLPEGAGLDELVERSQG